MDEERVRQIIRDELSYLIKNDKYVISKLTQILDGRNIQLGKTTGTIIGTETTQKLGFFGVEPAVQQTTITDPSGGATVDTQARASITEIKNVLTAFGLTS